MRLRLLRTPLPPLSLRAITWRLATITCVIKMKDRGREQRSQKNSFFHNKILRIRFCKGCGTKIFLKGGSTPPKWCAIPPWLFVLHRHICAIPHFATYRAIIVRYPFETSMKSFVMLSLQISRDIASIVAGPLRWCSSFFRVIFPCVLLKKQGEEVVSA